MDLIYRDIYTKALNAQEYHTKFLDATEKNLSYYLFGKVVPLVTKLTFPQVDLVQALANYTPEPYNPLAYLIDGFIDEIANSGFVVKVEPYPVKGKEPYQSYADQLEDYLLEVHRKAERHKFLKALLLSILVHGYFGLYTDGRKYWFLTAYDLIPGDPAVLNLKNQPFMVRRTQIRKADLRKIKGVDMAREELSSLEVFSEMDNVPLLDVWVKSLDLNLCFTNAGQLLYSQKFPDPKDYPMAIGNASELLNSFYSKPLISSLTPLLTKYQAAFSNIEESSKSIANPILLYDADAGIDVNALQRALKEGYKRIIIGKNREGNLAFRAPGQLPHYSLEMPDLQIGEMMHHLGISKSFFGAQSGGVRERGAIGRLMKTAFRKLGSVAAIAECAFVDIDEYLLKFAQSHQMALQEDSKFKNLEEIFQGNPQYIPHEKFKGFGSEDTSETKQFAMLKWKAKLVPQAQVLSEMGHSQPRKLMREVKEETKEQQEFLVGLRQAQEQAPVSILDQVSNRLKGKLKFRFFLMPIADDKVLIKLAEEDQKIAAFILSDLTGKVLIEIIKKEEKPKEQKGVEVKPEEKMPAPEMKEPLKQEGKEVKEETRGRPREKVLTPEEEMAKITEEKKKEEVPPEEKEVKKEETPKFSEEKLKVLIRRGHIIRKAEKYFKLPGLYLVDPHAKWIFTGKKVMLVKSRILDIKDKQFLLCGPDFVYGVIIVRDIISDFDLAATQKYHLISPKQAMKWWRGKDLYLYMFEFHAFEKPLEYERPEKVQTFIKDVKIKQEKIGVPFKGDLKPISLRPFRIPQPHKPEKKAFQPHEVFSEKRLMEIIPEATYDVSEKIDGLRTFIWKSGDKVKLYSDVGNLFPEARVQTLIDDFKKVFSHDVLIDGELIMEGIRRKDVAGYIHGKWTPTKEQLDSLRIKCWDILYVKDKSVASIPFYKRSAILDLYLLKGCKGRICRVKHSVVKRSGIEGAIKKLASVEGAVIRDISSAYWATHTTYKMKYQFDVDARVIAIQKTKTGLPVFQCTLSDGTFIGQTYPQSEITAKPGDVIRVNVDHVSILPSGRVNWYGPKPRSWKEGKITPKKISTTQVGIGGPDNLDLIKEIYLVTGGSTKEWEEWLPKHKEWKKEKMPAFIEQIKKGDKKA